MTEPRRALTASLAQEGDPSLLELEALLSNLGIQVVGSVFQRRSSPDPAGFLGQGKAEEVRRFAGELQARILAVDGELSPTQRRVLGERTGLEVWDRPYLIMKIFEARAVTAEAKWQVQLAAYRYEIPFLKGLGRQMSRPGGGIGTRGPGETEFERHRRKIERRIRAIEEKLRGVRKRRQERRERRRKEGRRTVALVGYTNSGKTTLLRLLSGDPQVQGADRLFATLDTASRRVGLPSGEEILFTDTVGFIRRLPPQLVAAFRATLEETREADLLLVVLDGSDPQVETHYEVVLETLEALEAGGIPRVILLNKADLPCEDRESCLPVLRLRGERVVPGSAVTGEGMEALLREVEARLQEPRNREDREEDEGGERPCSPA